MQRHRPQHPAIRRRPIGMPFKFFCDVLNESLGFEATEEPLQ
jgi:hypothetical protein